MRPSLSVVHTEPSRRRKLAPALSSPPKQHEPSSRPGVNHLNPTGTSKSFRPRPATTLAGEPIVAKLTNAPGNGAPIGGLKVVAKNGWFAARPSGTEDVYKIYAESFRDARHLDEIVAAAQEMVAAALR